MKDVREYASNTVEEKTARYYTLEEIEGTIVECINTVTGISIDDKDTPFYDYGITSIMIPEIINDLNERLPGHFKVELLFNFPSLSKLAAYIYQSLGEKSFEKKERSRKLTEEKIAIVGMSCRFPGGANDLEKYWELLINGIDGISAVPGDRWDSDKYYDKNKDVPGKMYNDKNGFLNIPIDEFDASFFGISPKEAKALDPQQRLLLELTWEAFENAGMNISGYQGSDTGVFVGISTNEYMMSQLFSGNLELIDAYSLTGTCMSTACGRISYTFGFEGPCISVDTACSSSLSGIHLACNSLKNNEMSLGVVAGVNLILTPATNVGFSKLRATSENGHCRSFDKDADGYVRGEGGGVLLLKRLSDALSDGNEILGVICATGINQDGKSNGLTAPNGDAQRKLIRNVLSEAQLEPADIDYIEMHGTGTKLGDPIEVSAVRDTYCMNRGDSSLMIGSVKSNIGHLEAASGIASIIKVLLSIRHDMIPANLNFDVPNPLIDWNEVIKVVSSNTEWKKKDKVRRAGVNGFGFGGSNAHLIIEEYKQEEEEPEEREQNYKYVLKLSAKTENSLNLYVQKYIDLLEKDNNSPESIIYTANSRSDFKNRAAFCGNDPEELLTALKLYQTGAKNNNVHFEVNKSNKKKKTVFMFTGQGSQYHNMALLLYRSNEVFRETMMICDTLFAPYINNSVIELIYSKYSDDEKIKATQYAQAAIFSVEYSLSKVMESLNVVPDVVMGHSIGEYVAAVISGIIGLEDAVKLVALRGKLMEQAPGNGKMATIFEKESLVQDLIGDCAGVSVAAVNAPNICVISGEADKVTGIVKTAEEKGIRAKELKVSHGFHSDLMEPVKGQFEKVSNEIEYNPPSIRFISSLYAHEADKNHEVNGKYWAEHIVKKVDFYGALRQIPNPEEYLFLEIGSNSVLSALCRSTFGNDVFTVSFLSINKPERDSWPEALASLYVQGIDIKWNNSGILNTKEHVIQDITYPFERCKYWTEIGYDNSLAVRVEPDSSFDALLGSRIESPFMENSVIYRKTFTSKQPYFMSEHVIFDTAISPAAAHISMMISMMKRLKDVNSCHFENVHFISPLAVLDDEQREVQFCIRDTDSGTSEFSIVSRGGTGDEWITHAGGKIRGEQTLFDDVTVCEAEQWNKLDFNDDIEGGIYRSMENSGFKLGIGFRRIKKVHSDEEKGICYLETLADAKYNDSYDIYPGMMDSILQTILCVRLEEVKDLQDKTLIPYSIDEIDYNYVDSENLWCVVESEYHKTMAVGNVWVFNEHGQIVVRLKKVVAKVTDSKTLLKNVKKELGDIQYRVVYTQEKATYEKKADDHKVYVIVSEDTITANKLCAALNEQGCASYIGTDKKNAQIIDNSYAVECDLSDVESSTEFVKLIASKTVDGKVMIVYANGLMSENDAIVGDFYSPVRGLFNLTKAIMQLNMEHRFSIKILTRNVESVQNNADVNVSQSMLWGFFKALSTEADMLSAGIIDVDGETIISPEKCLLPEIRFGRDNEVCIRKADTRYVCRLDHAKRNDTKPNSIIIDESASYLITGGTGTVGMFYAEKLIERNAKNIILMCRKEPGREVSENIEKLKKPGVQITIAYADVCDYDSVRKSLREVGVTMPVIKGVIHAAGIIEDALIYDMSWKNFENVVRTKVDGAVNIWKTIKDNRPDFFISLSSIASIIGNTGQCNYACANYFLNTFSEYISKKGTSGYTFCWGPWEKSGMAVRNAEISKNMQKMGLSFLSREEASQIIDQFFKSPTDRLVIAKVNWEKFISVYPSEIKRNFLVNLITGKEGFRTEKKRGEFLNVLKGLQAEERNAALIGKLRGCLSDILGFNDPSKVGTDVPISEQGVDSLMNFSYCNEINYILNIELNVSILFTYPTVLSLSSYLLSSVLKFEEDKSEREDVYDLDDTDNLLRQFDELLK